MEFTFVKHENLEGAMSRGWHKIRNGCGSSI